MVPEKGMIETESATAVKEEPEGFTEWERDAMKVRARELKQEARMKKNRAAGESAVLEVIAAMPEPDRSMATRIHELIQANAPDLWPRTWYGMPAYARNGKVVCFFQGAGRFQARYATLGFTDEANLDEGAMWPTSYAVKELTSAEEAKIVELINRTVR